MSGILIVMRVRIAVARGNFPPRIPTKESRRTPLYLFARYYRRAFLIELILESPLLLIDLSEFANFVMAVLEFWRRRWRAVVYRLLEEQANSVHSATYFNALDLRGRVRVNTTIHWNEYSTFEKRWDLEEWENLPKWRKNTILLAVHSAYYLGR